MFDDLYIPSFFSYHHELEALSAYHSRWQKYTAMSLQSQRFTTEADQPASPTWQTWPGVTTAETMDGSI